LLPSQQPCCSQTCNASTDISAGIICVFLLLQSQGPAEPSEEVRLLLLQLLGVIVQQAGSAVAAYATEVWSILSAGLADSFHEAAEQACRTVQRLAGEFAIGNVEALQLCLREKAAEQACRTAQQLAGEVKSVVCCCSLYFYLFVLTTAAHTHVDPHGLFKHEWLAARQCMVAPRLELSNFPLLLPLQGAWACASPPSARTLLLRCCH
jgi:hypothetical protein